MKSKLGNIFKVISEYDQRQKELPSPEYIALRFMEWKKNKTGENVSYFIEGRRTNSKAWKYFEELSEELFKILREGQDFTFNKYFDERSRKACGNKNLYPYQFIYRYKPKVKIKEVFGVDIVYTEPETFHEWRELVYHCLGRIPHITVQELFESSEIFPPVFVEEYCRYNDLGFEYEDLHSKKYD